MTDERLTELQEKYKDRDLLEELAWGVYANHSGYTSKQNGEFLNWLCLMAYKALKERPQGEWIEHYDNSDGFTWLTCSRCLCKAYEDNYNFCPNCGADMRGGVNMSYGTIRTSSGIRENEVKPYVVDDRPCEKCIHKVPVPMEDGTWTAECEVWNCHFVDRAACLTAYMEANHD